MKIVSKEQQDAASNAALVGGAKGGAFGLAAFIPAFWLAGRRFPVVANLPITQKSFLSLIAFLGAGATNAELSYEKHLREEWSGPTAEALRQQAAHDRDEWVTMSPREKVTRWAAQNKYQIVFGSWVASMIGSAGFIFARNPTQTFSQKLVQCRMVAQGATVAVLIASAGLSRVQFEEPDQKTDHSWQDMLNQPAEQAPALGSVHTHHAPTK